MTDIPAGLRARLAADFSVHSLEVISQTPSKDGTTNKLLLAAGDGELLEAVSIREGGAGSSPGRHTVCVSSQVGCAMACQFCASGLDGVVRQLTAGEMVEQLLHVRRLHGAVSNVVFMGMGEPLANFDNVVAALTTLTSAGAIGVSARRVTVSTVGVVPGIRRLGGLGLRVGLAVSLHAPDDVLRAQLVPSARRWPVTEILQAARDYAVRSGRTITYEYVLLDGVNDGAPEAQQLGELLAGQPAKVNLIPYNPVPDLADRFRRPSTGRVAAFCAIVRQHGVPTTVRTAKGDEVAAACGQLRRQRDVPESASG